jgi:lipopolysaccharide export system protein LptA
MSMRRSTPTLSAVLLLPLLLATSGLEARKGDRDQPMDVRSDRQSGGLGDDDSIVLSGNVEITQGSLVVNAATATVERRGGDLQRIVLEGSPVRIRQQNERGEVVDAQAARVTYAPDDEIMLLDGGARVAQERGDLQAETIRYNLDTGTIDSGGDGNRVQMTIQPKARAAAN